VRPLRTAASVGGLAAVAATVALVFGAVPSERVAPFAAVTDAVGGRRFLLLLAVTLLLAGLWFARRRGSSTNDRYTQLRETPPEGVAAPASIRVGGEFDRLVGEAVASDDDGAMRPVVARLRETATELCADATDADRETARRRIEDGAWTDDALAAAFLAGDGRMPFRARIRAWLDPARERRRRVDATLDALFELRRGVVPATTTDDPSGSVADTDSDEPDRDSDASSGEADDSGADPWVARVDGRER
jgi:hypothetical protein